MSMRNWPQMNDTRNLAIPILFGRHEKAKTKGSMAEENVDLRAKADRCMTEPMRCGEGVALSLLVLAMLIKRSSKSDEHVKVKEAIGKCTQYLSIFYWYESHHTLCTQNNYWHLITICLTVTSPWKIWRWQYMKHIPKSQVLRLH